jgi:5-formyltetrahydrofolate cyclo-ligase
VNKSDLRKHYLTQRKQLSDEQLSAASKAICHTLLEWTSQQDAWWDSIRSIHCFLPIRKQKEVDTLCIIRALRLHYPHIRVVISRMNASDNSLEHFLWEDSTELRENSAGIPEPVSGQPYPADQIDLVLVPLLIFDQSGHRIGYGKGYYDRFLATCRIDTLKVGLSIFDPVDDFEEKNDWDIELDYCVTPQKVWMLG